MGPVGPLLLLARKAYEGEREGQISNPPAPPRAGKQAKRSKRTCREEPACGAK